MNSKIETCACVNCHAIGFNILWKNRKFFLECINCGFRTSITDIPSWRGNDD